MSWICPEADAKVAAMNTDARVQAQQYYQAAGRDMAADLAALAAHPHGVVLLMPQLVALLRPVDSTKPPTWQELDSTSTREDAWYVHLLVGNLALARRLAAALPPRRWLCFQRGLRSPRAHRLSWSAFCHQPTTHS